MKILHVDLETSYVIGAVWGMYDQNVASILQNWYILGFGYSWNHLSSVHWVGMSDFPKQYKQDHTNDYKVIEELHRLLDEADVIVAHNAKGFDVKKIKGRFLFHGFPPPSHYHVLDTKQLAKQFGSISNKLDDLSAQYLGERKMKNDGIDLWTRCMARYIDEKAWKQMATYCKKDVVLLKRWYQKILPWIDSHPDWNVYEDMKDACPNCGSSRTVKNGHLYTLKKKYQSYLCRNCGHQFKGKYVPMKW